MLEFDQGMEVRAEDERFSDALAAAVDYRGDVSLRLREGEEIFGFLFNHDETHCELFTPENAGKTRLPISEIALLSFTGKDEAKGKGWEDWIQKKAQEEANTGSDSSN